MTKRLFLPISQETLELIIFEDISIDKTYGSLSIPELSSLLIINRLTDLIRNKISVSEIESALASTIKAANESGSYSNSNFHNLVANKIDINSLKAGLKSLQQTTIRLLTNAEVVSRSYLTSLGEWDTLFSIKHKPIGEPRVYEVNTTKSIHTLRDQQYRLLNEIKANADDDLEIQGYAGTGKTFLLSIVLETLFDKGIKPNQVAVLAYRPAQIKAIQSRLPASIKVTSYGDMARSAIPYSDTQQKLNRLKTTYRHKFTFNTEKYTDELNIKAVAGYSGTLISNCIFFTLRNYCLSQDNYIEDSHIPKTYKLLSQTDRAYIVQQANMMWGLTIDRPENLPLQLPLNDYHIIKFVALNGWSLPNMRSHIILDESQDLPASFLQILDRSQNVVLSLGDKFQTVNKTSGDRSSIARARQMNDSARVPMSLNQIINKVLGDSPYNMYDVFKGNPDRNTEVSYYLKPKLPNESCAIWVHDEWEMLEWAQIASSTGKTITFLWDVNNFSKFVAESLELFRNNIPSRIFALSKFNSWNDAWNTLHNNEAFVRVTRMFEKGFKYSDWEETKKRYSGNGYYVIGRYEEARGHEYNTVLLAPSIIHQLTSIEKKDSSVQSLKSLRYEISSKIYLGTTRTRSKLYAPKQLHSYIEES